ncbi:MAG TPA: NADP-dependent oxidoreductase [Polyangiaceae bacterium]|jgi:NADPH:quinone reductase-like Zn-dependent oxidoreductase
MKAIRVQEYGGPEVLRFEDAPDPVPGDDDVLVRVRAAGVNPVDWKVREGRLKESVKYKLPMIPGWDLSGVVVATGAKASRFLKGEEVFGRPDIARDGAYAELVTVREGTLARKPESIDHVTAAAVPLTALTAWQALFDAAPGFQGAHLQPGQTVLVHAASGGVGTFAVQLAKNHGARVIGTCSTDNVAYVRSLGADEVVDYKKTRFEDVARDVDVVLDLVGGETQQRSWGVLKKGGILVSITSTPSADEAKKRGVRAGYVFVQPSSDQLASIATMIDAGKLRVEVSKVLPLSAAREAHELSQAGHTRGKIVLRVE